MKKKIILILVIIFLNVFPVLAQAKREPVFRYVIVSNKASDDERWILVFFEEKSFSKENLKKLYSRLSEKYPVPIKLHIEVETIWKMIPTPDETLSLSSEQVETDEEITYRLWSLYVRTSENEFFRYNAEEVLPSGRIDPSMKTVTLKGKD
jgi:hypothetical protein